MTTAAPKTLLACPFCGGAANLTTRPASPTEDAPWLAFVSCFCGGYSSCAHKMAGGFTEQEAASNVTALWNHRAPQINMAKTTPDSLKP